MTGQRRGEGWRRSPMIALVALLGGLLPSASLSGQATEGVRAEVGAEPAAVRVGEPFTAALRVVAPPGVQVEYGEPAPSDSLQLLAPVDLGPGEGDVGGIALYRMVAWVAGTPLRAVVPVQLITPDGETEERWVRLHLPEVESVLPAEDEAIEPRPARGVISPPLIGQGTWFWWLLLVGVLLAILLAYALLERARRALEDATVPVDPRAWALRRLDAVGEGANSDASQRALVHHRVVRILRSYCALVDRGWSPDLTTSEVVLRVSEDEGEGPGRELGAILHAADRVRFGGLQAPPGRAAEIIERARVWVSLYPAGLAPSDSPRAA